MRYLVLTLALALNAGTALAGKDGTTTALNGGNLFNVEQVGDNNFAYGSQNAATNSKVILYQEGGTYASVTQSGDSNKVTSNRDENYNTITGLHTGGFSAVQNGNNNRAAVNFENGSSASYASVNQLYGNNNEALVDIAGNKNTVYSYQYGDNNNAQIQENGNDNILLTYSINGNNIYASQSGNGNYAYAWQKTYGLGNSAYLDQSGDSNIAYVNQSGSGNQASVVQVTSNNNASIVQSGNGNTATVWQ